MVIRKKKPYVSPTHTLEVSNERHLGSTVRPAAITKRASTCGARWDGRHLVHFGPSPSKPTATAAAILSPQRPSAARPPADHKGRV